MRLFVGLWPPPEVAEVLEQISRPDQPDVRWTTREQWHVTLRFLGEVPDGDVPELVGALAAVGRCPSRMAVLGPATARLGRQSLVAPVSGLDDLARAVLDATGRFGAPPEDRPFTGHLTLARGRGGRPVPPQMAGEEVGASWPVNDLALVRSSLSSAGASYETITTTSLASGPAA